MPNFEEKQPVCLLLAGGFATRLWPLTEKRAKPLLPLAGKPLIRHIIEKIPAHIPLIISTNQQFQDDFEHLKSEFPNRNLTVFIEDSDSDQSKRGALAATALVIDEFGIDSPLLLIAGDNFFGFNMQSFLESYTGKSVLASYDTKSLEAARQFGVVDIDGKKLVGFVEKPQDPPSTLVSTGCYLFSPEDLMHIKDYSLLNADNLGGVFEYLLARKQDVEVFQFDEEWIDIGSFESYLAAHNQLMDGSDVHHTSAVSNSTLGDAVHIGENVVIEDSVLEEVIVMDNCVIKNSHLRSCIIDKGCVIEGVDLTKKMIRAGSEIQHEE
ncbi:MAG: NDP-sugar synthase [Candidatus Gracilibacteria bacterium]|nr:NDP-sugar synthase [Candidatus Gracilibacteria bacterium]